MNAIRKVCLFAAAVVLLQAAVAGAQEGVAADAQPRLLAFEAARDYLEASRYPDHSKALPAGAVDPLRDERTTHPITVEDRDLGRVLSVWSAQLSYRPGETPTFYALAAGFEPSAVVGEIADEAGAFSAELVFHDDGAGADEAAGDGVYTARYSLADRRAPELARAYRVSVDAAPAEGTPLTATTGFVFSNPWADLTGKYRHSIVDGNLVIEAQLSVRRAGRFHLAGVLHTPAGEPIGTAQAARHLEPGRHWMPLEFYGLMFHDRQVQGAVKLGSLALSTTGGMPNALNELVTDAHVVHRLDRAALGAAPFGTAADLEAARRLEADGRRSLEERRQR